MRMEQRTIRRASLPEDAEGIIEVFSAAKAIMASSGNANQWKDGYPSLDVVRSDIDQGGSYVIEDGGSIVAYFAFLPSPEPTYSKIYDGEWIDDDLPYHVIHRIASISEARGIFKSIMDFCFAQDSNIRIDTHRDNHIMQHNIEKYGFTCCGIIHLDSGGERIAYQKKEDTIRILFLHGFYASGQCIPAVALREAFDGRAEVITPDLPMHPKEAIRYIRELCDREKLDVLVGNSCGSFYAQIVAPLIEVPALLGNPHFQMTEFLQQRIGKHQYKSPRKDGCKDFVIDEQLTAEFANMELHQFDGCTSYGKEHVWGLFGEQDTLAHFEPLFLKHYTHSFHFPGGHTPTADEVRNWYVPLIEKILHYTGKTTGEPGYPHFIEQQYGLETEISL